MSSVLAQSVVGQLSAFGELRLWDKGHSWAGRPPRMPNAGVSSACDSTSAQIRAQLARCFAHRLVFSRDVADYETHHKRVRLFPGEGHENYSGGPCAISMRGAEGSAFLPRRSAAFPSLGTEAVDLVVEPLKQLTQFERRAAAAILQNRNHEIPLTRSTFHPSSGAKSYRAWRISKYIGTAKIPWLEYDTKLPAKKRDKLYAQNKAKREECFAKALERFRRSVTY